MGNLSRQYKTSTIKRLYALSGNKCTNPNCQSSLLGWDQRTMVDEITHIEAASPGGPRYNSRMSDEERRGFENLLLLCQPCHKIVDNPENKSTYTVELLREWKKTHEDRQKSEHLKNPGLLRMAIKAIAKAKIFESSTQDKSLKAINPEEKIKYNNIIRNKSLIDEYKIYYAKINSVYQELEKQGSFEKESLLNNIHSIYLKVLGKYILDSDEKQKIRIIREKADDIFDDVQDELVKSISSDVTNNYFEILVIMVDAFIRCKILEEPKI